MKNSLKEMGMEHWGFLKEILKANIPSRADPELFKLEW
jgi:hypothetical protein